jgi:hypothetical protein
MERMMRLRRRPMEKARDLVLSGAGSKLLAMMKICR